MEKIYMIMGTADEIYQGMSKILAEHSEKKTKSDFGKEKMTVSQASHFIDVSYQTLCKWIKENKIPVHGQGRTRFVLKSELIEAYKIIS